MSRLITYSLFLTPLTFFICSLIEIDRKKLKIALGVYFSFSTILFLWGLLHFFATKNRPSGPVGDANVYAGLLLVFILPVLVYLIVNKAENKSQKKNNDYLYLYITLGVGAFFSADSRSAILALIILFLFIVLKIFLEYRAKFLNRCIIAGLLLITAYFIINLFAAGNNTLNRAGLQDIGQDKPIQARLMIWKTSLEIYKEQPVTGIGFGQFKSFYRQSRNPLELESTGEFVHNDYLQFLLEGGIVQLLFFAFLSLILIYQFFKNLFSKSKNSHIRQLKLFTVICLCCIFFIQAVANFIFYVPVCATIIGALLAYISRVSGSNSAVVALKNNSLIILSICSAVFISTLSMDIFIIKKIPVIPNMNDKFIAKKIYSLSEKLTVVRPNSLTLYRHRFLYNLFILVDKDNDSLEVETLEKFESTLQFVLNISDSDAITLHYLGLLAEEKKLIFSKLKNNFTKNIIYNIQPREFYEKSIESDPGIILNYIKLHNILMESDGLENAYYFLKNNLEKRVNFKEIEYKDYFLTTELLLEDAYKLRLMDDASKYANEIITHRPCNEFALKTFGLERPDNCR